LVGRMPCEWAHAVRPYGSIYEGRNEEMGTAIKLPCPYYPITIIGLGFFKSSDFQKLMQNLILFRDLRSPKVNLVKSRQENLHPNL
jgi:hypothetical protein